jgi:hypothetical protein
MSKNGIIHGLTITRIFVGICGAYIAVGRLYVRL